MPPSVPLAAWVASVLLCAGASVHLVRRARRAAPPAFGPRAAALLAVLGTGALLGAAAVRLTGSPYGLLVLPGVLATGWLFLADPLACRPEPAGGAEPTGRTRADRS